MKRIKTVVIACTSLAVICFCSLIYAKAQKSETKMPETEKMTVEETVQVLLQYIYDEDYFPLCTKYCSKEDGPLLTVYSDMISYPVFEFEIPNDKSHIRRQVFCKGETEDGEYLLLGIFSWLPQYAVGGEQSYSRAELYSYFAVNRRTKEIVQQRDTNEEEKWVYDPLYYEIAEEPIAHKDFYE